MIPSSDFQILRYSSIQQYEKDLAQSANIILEKESSWTHAGAFLNPASMPASYDTWCRGTFRSGSILPLLAPLLAFLHKYLAQTHLTHYCLTIRAQKSTKDFDIPRWHVDRRFFEDPESPNDSGKISGKGDLEEGLQGRRIPTFKMAAAILGPGTLFLKDSARGRALQRKVVKGLKMEQKKKGHYTVDGEHVCKSFRCLGCADMAEAVRYKLAEEVEELEVIQARNGEMAVFQLDATDEVVGEGAMHSEPVMSGGDRVFVNIVPGREEELRTLLTSWGMEFPRDWSVGICNDWVDLEFKM